MKLRIIFWGSPTIAVPFLKCIAYSDNLVGIVTRQDKISGRGHRVHQTPVAEAAPQECVIQKPVTLKDPAFNSWVKSVKHDVSIVVAYGKIIPEEILVVPQHGFINIHFSFLPQYRGAAPIQHALLNDETETGVTAFSLRKKLDEGPVLIQKKVSVLPQDNYVTLTPKLIDCGLDVLQETIAQLKKGHITSISQTGAVSYAPLIQKENGHIAWNTLSAREVKNKIRALIEWPCAYTYLPNKKLLKIVNAELSDCAEKGKPGEITELVKGRGFIVKCSDKSLLILRVIPEGTKEMSAYDCINGRVVRIGDILQ